MRNNKQVANTGKRDIMLPTARPHYQIKVNQFHKLNRALNGNPASKLICPQYQIPFAAT